MINRRKCYILSLWTYWHSLHLPVTILASSGQIALVEGSRVLPTLGSRANHLTAAPGTHEKKKTIQKKTT
jgi:hypothetical protein